MILAAYEYLGAEDTWVPNIWCKARTGGLARPP